MEKIIRDNGVVPATIGILKGKVKVGKYKSLTAITVKIKLLSQIPSDQIQTSRHLMIPNMEVNILEGKVVWIPDQFDMSMIYS